MKKYSYMIIDDKQGWIDMVIECVQKSKVNYTEFIPLEPTKMLIYQDFITDIKDMANKPNILFVDYELHWKGGSSAPNGVAVVRDIIRIYPQNKLPFVIFISQPNPNEILSASNDLHYIQEEAMSLALDKGEFDDTVEGTEKTKFQVALEKAIRKLDEQRIKKGTVSLMDIYDYPVCPDYFDNNNSALLFTRFKKECITMTFDNSTFLMILFKTDTVYNFMSIILYENNRVSKYLKSLGRKTKDSWINYLNKEGLLFEIHNSIIFNPKYLRLNHNNRIEAIENSMQQQLYSSFVNELFIRGVNERNHPFYFQLKKYLSEESEL